MRVFFYCEFLRFAQNDIVRPNFKPYCFILRKVLTAFGGQVAEFFAV